MIRNATIKDCHGILKLITENSDKGLMIGKDYNEICQSIQNFIVFDMDGKVMGCSRLDIVSDSLGEVASVAVACEERKKGIGKNLTTACIERARKLGLPKLFLRTYADEFFSKSGFYEVEKSTLPKELFTCCITCPKSDNCDEHTMVLDLK